MRLNSTLKMRISSEMNETLNSLSAELGFTKTALIRLLLSRSIKQLKSDSIKVGGIQNLEFSIK